MGRMKKGLLEEVHSHLSASIAPFSQGWRRLLPLTGFLVLLLIFGVAAAIMIVFGLAGMFAIVVIARSNSRWMRDEQVRRSKRKKR
ncbi:hypothetical protein IH980_03805 [Patescibacteria group bacterium]|nr:hypothetical protein [Patescibacteria group bacterium]